MNFNLGSIAKAYPWKFSSHLSFITPKYFQTLKGHTIDALKILKIYIKTNMDVIEQFCNRWQLNKESFLKSLFIIVYLHDIGKLIKQFQNNIRNGKTSQKFPHAFYSLFLLNNIKFTHLFDFSIENIAILGHHTQLNSQLYGAEFSKPVFIEEEIHAFIKNAEPIYNDLCFNEWFSFEGLKIDPLPEMRKFWGIIQNYKNDLIKTTSAIREKTKLKSIFCYIFSILKTCDIYSSDAWAEFISTYDGNISEFDSVIQDPSKYVLEIHINDPYEKILRGKSPYQYQMDDQLEKLCKAVPFYGLLFAPCGRGKTETALIWALKSLKKYKRNKIIFAMPTQITSNAMWERFCNLFAEGETEQEKNISGRNCVGLFHGMSFIKFKEEKKQEKEEDEDLTAEDLDEIRGENFKGNIFYKPITVTTIDHLIYSFIHGFSHADFALGNLQNAVIVFDEVHYYEKNRDNPNQSTTDHLVTLLQILKEMKIPHLLMSGTLPEFFEMSAKHINSEYEGPFQDTEGLYFEPFKIDLITEKLITKKEINKKILSEIITNYKQGLIQFIIVNTIERSKWIFDKLITSISQFDDIPKIILHHSQFTHQDRADKEKFTLNNLKKDKMRPFILVATQVIEISLDISCDLMYTELAPGDALGQRGGRLNRGGYTPFSNNFEYTMKIFIPEELDEVNPKKKPYEIDLLKNTLESIVKGNCSYNNLKKVCDHIYKDYQIVPTVLKRVFNECSIFGYSPWDINFNDEDQGRLIQIRSNEIQTFDVIPWEYYAENEQNLIIENQVKVPLWWYKQDEKKHGISHYFTRVSKKIGNKEKYFWVTKIPYSKERGFDYRGYCKTENLTPLGEESP